MKKGWEKLNAKLEPLLGFGLFYLLTALLTLMALSLSWAWPLLLLWLGRLLAGRKPLLLGTCLLIGLFFSLRAMTQAKSSRLDPEASTYELVVAASQIKVDGDRVSGLGRIQGEYVKWTYTCKQAEEKEFFQENRSNLVLKAKGSLEALKGSRGALLYDEAAATYQTHGGFYRLKITSFALLKSHYNIWTAWQKSLQLQGHVLHLVNQMVFGHIEDQDYVQPFQLLGLYFLVSLSGLQVKWLLNLLSYVCLRLGLRRSYTKGLLAGLSLLLTLVAWPLSLGPLKYLIVANVPHRNHQNFLAWLALGSLALNPWAFYSLSFQFAFGLALVSSLAGKKMATGLLICLLSYHYYRISLIGLLAMPLFIAAFKWLILPLTWLVLLCPWFQGIINWILDPLYNFLDHLIALPNLSLVTGRQALVFYASFLVFLALTGKARDPKYLRWAYPVLALACLLPKPAFRALTLNLDGNSLLLQWWYSSVLINTGGKPYLPPKADWQISSKPRTFEYAGLSQLQALGISQLDAIIITEDKTSHKGYLDNFLEAFHPTVIISADKKAIWQTQTVIQTPMTLTIRHLPFMGSQLLKGDQDFGLSVHFEADLQGQKAGLNLAIKQGAWTWYIDRAKPGLLGLDKKGSLGWLAPYRKRGGYLPSQGQKEAGQVLAEEKSPLDWLP